ncbi:MAG: LacI family transcriptional regulator [Chlorobi bacterium]|nr:LacI family transcriptional regulator [Chlorobiota bacterium]
MKATIYDIAKKAGVSTATVSRALGEERERVKPKTREKILKVCKDLNYQPNRIAKNLAKKSTGAIGLVLPEIQGDFYTEIIRGVDEIAYSGNYNLIVSSSHSRRNIVESILGFMRESMVDGVILMIPSMNRQIEEILSKFLTPIVIISDIEGLGEYDKVSIDNYQGAYSMTEYLIKSLKHKKIAAICGPRDNQDATMRKKGYVAALKKYKIPIRKEWIIESDFTIEGGEIASSRLLSLSEKPDVIFAANDNMAAGCYKTAEALGYKAPEDIGIVGFDHIAFGAFLKPKLTTVHVQVPEIGRVATNLLLDRLKDSGSNKKASPKNIKISTGIIIGDSVLKAK